MTHQSRQLKRKMGIRVELNPDLALRNVAELESGNRKEGGCAPEKLETGKIYDFLKSDQRNYWLSGEIPLIETKENEVLSRPIASIRILEATHFNNNGNINTKGKYKIIEVFKNNNVKFECFYWVGQENKTLNFKL